MSMTGRQIYQNFMEGPGAQELDAARAVLEELARDDAEVGGEIQSAAAALESLWEGESAGAAQRGAGPLAVDHSVTSEHVHTAQDLLRRQVESFDHAKSNVVPVPDVPDSPPTLADVVADPDTATYYQAKQQALAAEEQNVRTMSLWDNHSSYNEQMMPTRYGNDIDTTFKESDVGTGGRASVDAGSASAPQVGTGAPGGSGSTTAAATTLGGVGAVGGTSGATGRHARSGGPSAGATHSAAAPAPSTIGSGQDATGRHARPVARPGTTTGAPGSGVNPIGPGSGSSTGTGPRVGSPGGATRGGVPGSSGGPRVGSPGAGGGVRGGLPGAGGQPGGQSGRLAGGVPGAGGPGGGGSAGRGGMAGGGPGMAGGGGAGRGRGPDDQEHKDKYALPEQFDDGLQREVDEYGERTIDEQSGRTVVPPVIGERDVEPHTPKPAQEQTSTPKPAPAGPAQAAGTQPVRSSNPYAPPSAGADRPRQP